jgi:hypothetical protein
MQSLDPGLAPVPRARALLSARVGVCSLVLIALLSGCERQPRLSVELVTDLDPQAEFNGIYVERAHGTLTSKPACRAAEGDEFERKRDYRAGVQVGEATRVEAGDTWTVRVTLCRDDEVVVHRSVQHEIERDTELRVVIASGCLHHECGERTPCDYKHCEPSIECHWGRLDACESLECGRRDLTCEEGQECVAGDCLRRASADAGGDAADVELDAGPQPGHREEGGADSLDAEADAYSETGPASDTDGRVLPEADAEGGVPEPFTKTHPARVLYVGDAIAAETQNAVTFWTANGGKVEFLSSIGGRVALCDFLEGEPGALPAGMRLRQVVADFKPHLVIMQFWGDLETECMSGLEAGTEPHNQRLIKNVNAAVSTIEAALGGPTRILWVLQGPDRANPGRIAMLNQIYSNVASAFGGRTSDAGRAVSEAASPVGNNDRLEWVQFSPCNSYEMQLSGLCHINPSFGPLAQMHRNDRADGTWGYHESVLFCLGNTKENFACDEPLSPGIHRYGMSIANDVNSWLGFAE